MNICACKVRFLQNPNTPDKYEFTSPYVYWGTAALNFTIEQTETWTLLVAS